MSLKSILANLGFLMQIAGIFMIFPILVGFRLGEIQAIISLFITATTFLGFGFILNALAERKELGFKSSCSLIFLAFVFFGLIGAIPYLYNAIFLGTPLETMTNSVFEAVSGYTTTGFSFVSNTDKLPKSILVYRSLTELIGGIGVVFILLAFFYPEKSLVSISRAMGIDKINDSIKRTFFDVVLIYVIYIAGFSALFYFLGSRDLIGSVTSVIDLLTGGYEPAGFATAGTTLKALGMALMAVGSFSFVLSHNLFTLNFKRLFNEEDFFYFLLLAFASGVFFLAGMGGFDSAFHAVSLGSSSGVTWFDFSHASEALKVFAIFIIFVGGSRFSMAGGIKVYRLVLAIKSIPHAVGIFIGSENKMKFDGREIENKDALVELSLVLSSLFLVTVTATAFSLVGHGFLDSLFETSSAFATNGVTTGITNVSMAIWMKWTMIALMIIGRIEIFAFFAVFYFGKISNSKNVFEQASKELENDEELKVAEP